MPAYLAVMVWAWADAKPSNATAVATMMRMKLLPEVRYCSRNGRVALTCLSMKQARVFPRLIRDLMRGLLFHAADQLCRIDEPQRDQEPDHRQRHIDDRHRVD